MKKNSAALLLAAALLSRPLFCQTAPIAVRGESVPLISSINGRDKDFMLKQFDGEVEENRRLENARKEYAPSFYAYTAKAGDDLFSLAGRFCIRYDSFCVLNGITDSGEELSGRRLLLPSADGLFVPLKEEDGLSSLEILLQKNRLPLLEASRHLRYTVDGREFAFFPGEKFSPTERAFFLDSSLRLPVNNYRISSRFGARDDPFGGNKVQFHKGVDMAVPEGTSVFACKGGTVLGTGENRVYGKWIQLAHGRGMTSFYAHLSAIMDGMKKGRAVRSGDLIAKSGSTGQVTGPHLHFEIRLNGTAVNPEGYGDF